MVSGLIEDYCLGGCYINLLNEIKKIILFRPNLTIFITLFFLIVDGDNMLLKYFIFL